MKRWVTARATQLLLIAVATGAALYARTAVSPLQEAMRTSLLLTDNQMSLLQGPALALPMVFLGIPLGLAIDRCSRVRLMLLFCASSAAGTLATGLVAQFPALFAARCLVGLAGPASWVTAMSLIADWYSPAQRGRANMMVVLGQCGGNSAAFALGGSLLGVDGAGSDGWRQAIVIMALPLAAVLTAALMLKEPVRVEQALSKPSLRTASAELWRYRRVIAPLLLGLSMLGIADAAAVTWVAPALSRHFAVSPERIGNLMAGALLVSGVLGPILGGGLADACQRFGGPRHTMAVLGGLAFFSVPAALFALTSNSAAASILLCLFLLLGSASVVVGTTLFTIVVPNELRGLCMSILSAAFLILGFGLAPPAVSVLSGVIGGPSTIGLALAVVCATISTVGTLVFVMGWRAYASAVPA